MTNEAVTNKLRMCAMTLAPSLALGATPLSQAHGVGSGGSHGGSIGGLYGGRGSFGGHSGFAYGHYRYGRFGYNHFGYGAFGFYDGLGLLGYGLFLDTLPLYYSTYWWGDIPYYYANDNFYEWNPSVGQYETVRPPQSLAGGVATTQAPESISLFAYPKNGQTAAQEATDRLECQNWAKGQAGIESPPTDGTAMSASSLAKRHDYLRAQSACLEGRGYSVQ
jgi:hypothetical protein